MGRWLTIDPKFKQYPYSSPYVAFGNNPEYYVDPGGETLRVAGDEKAREAARAALQKLTNDKVIVQADGLVKVVAGNENPGKKLVSGTQLIRDVVEHKRTTEMLVGSYESYQHNDNDENARNGIGSDGYVVMGSGNVLLLTKDRKTGKISMKPGGKSLNLVTELIHAVKGMDGTQRKKTWIEQSTYTDENGKTQTEIQQREELETHGLGGTVNYKKDGKAYVSEKDIRQEQGEGERVAYDPEYNTTNTGEKYKTKKD